jgi:hypothetical protein
VDGSPIRISTTVPLLRGFLAPTLAMDVTHLIRAYSHNGNGLLWEEFIRFSQFHSVVCLTFWR